MYKNTCTTMYKYKRCAHIFLWKQNAYDKIYKKKSKKKKEQVLEEILKKVLGIHFWNKFWGILENIYKSWA